MDKSSKKVYSFLREATNYERILLKHSLNLSDQVREFVFKYKIKPSDFCKRVGVSTRQYSNCLNGAFDYNLEQISKFEAWMAEKAKETIDKLSLISVPEPEPLPKPIKGYRKKK